VNHSFFSILLEQLRQTHRRLPVIMFSTLTERGAVVTLDCLALGASDYVMKPSNVSNFEAAKERIREQLIPKIKALCRLPGEITPVAAAPPERRMQVVPRAQSHHLSRVDVVAIGASTGGPNALAEVLAALPADLPVPVLAVQHMPPVFTKFLAKRLDGICPLRVAEAAPGELVGPGTVWIAAGDYHLKVFGTKVAPVIGMDQAPPQNSCRPSVDVLFHSAAEVYGGNVLAVVLTGMGQDGLRGTQELRELGARIVVQDEATSVVWGMPGFIARADLAHRVLPLSEIGQEIVRTVTAPPPFQTTNLRN